MIMAGIKPRLRFQIGVRARSTAAALAPNRTQRPVALWSLVDIMHLMRNSKGRFEGDLWGFLSGPRLHP